MDTNSQQFQKAYSDLISAFINFMNVVNPNSVNGNEAILHLIASQLNQVLQVVKAQTTSNPYIASNSGSTFTPSTFNQNEMSNPETNTVISPQQTSAPSNDSSVSETLEDSGAETKIFYSQYPVDYNGKLVFKGISLKQSSDKDLPYTEQGTAYLYKLTIDQKQGKGRIEIVPNPSGLDIISKNKATYLPSRICQLSNDKEDISEISSESVLKIKAEGRSWALEDGEKFIINIK